MRNDSAAQHAHYICTTTLPRSAVPLCVCVSVSVCLDLSDLSVCLCPVCLCRVSVCMVMSTKEQGAFETALVTPASLDAIKAGLSKVDVRQVWTLSRGWLYL